MHTEYTVHECNKAEMRVAGYANLAAASLRLELGEAQIVTFWHERDFRRLQRAAEAFNAVMAESDDAKEQDATTISVLAAIDRLQSRTQAAE